MNGEQINDLCKVLTIFDNKAIHMTDTLKVIDDLHVMLIVVESLDGTPVFGIADEKVTIDVKKMLKMKIGAKEELTPTFESGKYIISNEDVEYQFKIEEAVNRLPVVPKLDNLNYIEVERKALKTFINQASDISDFIKLSTDNGELHGYCSSSDVKLKRKLGTCDGDLNVFSMYPTDYMKKWVKVAGTTVTIGLDTEYPMTAEWSDKYYKYKVILAPRIERD